MTETSTTAHGIFYVTDLNCPGCMTTITKKLYKLDGIIKVNVNYITDKAYVDYDPEKVSDDTIKKTIRKAGYRAFQSQQGMMQ